MTAKVIAVIPARMAASRFPGKPLEKIFDLPMIEHVRRRVLLSDVVDDVYVATCDQEIADVVEKHGGKAIMTSAAHKRCTDRVEEAMRGIYKNEEDIIVIVQGDEPLFRPESIKLVIYPILAGTDINYTNCTNLLSIITDKDDLDDIDVVKAVVNLDNNIMYYSRAPVPFIRYKDTMMYRQTGLSAFTRKFLWIYTDLSPTPLEIADSIDFVRILEHGHQIRAVITQDQMHGVDRSEDIEVVENIIKTDPVQREYYQRILRL